MAKSKFNCCASLMWTPEEALRGQSTLVHSLVYKSLWAAKCRPVKAAALSVRGEKEVTTLTTEHEKLQLSRFVSRLWSAASVPEKFLTCTWLTGSRCWGKAVRGALLSLRGETGFVQRTRGQVLLLMLLQLNPLTPLQSEFPAIRGAADRRELWAPCSSISWNRIFLRKYLLDQPASGGSTQRVTCCEAQLQGWLGIH